MFAKSHLLTALLTLFFISSSAEAARRVGIYGLYNLTALNVSNAANPNGGALLTLGEDTERVGNSGGGLFFELMIQDTGVGLELGGFYQNMGFKDEASGDQLDFAAAFEYLMIRYNPKLTKTAFVNAGIGAYAMQVVGDVTVTDGADGTETETTMSNSNLTSGGGIKNHDLGFILSVQVAAVISESTDLILDARYMTSFSEVFHDSTDSTTNPNEYSAKWEMYQLLLGLAFKF